jgi:hypothetical protein
VARVTLTVDSATPDEVYDLTLAFQRTSGPVREQGRFGGHEVPEQITRQPVVSVTGSAMSWRSPALTAEHAAAVLGQYAALRDHQS